MKLLYRILILVTAIVLSIILNHEITALAQGFNYIENNGVRLKKVENYKVKGRVNLQGYSSRKVLKALVIKDKKQTWYDIDKVGNGFKKDIFLKDGVGRYEVYVMVGETTGRFSFGPGITVVNELEINKFTSPGMYIESDNIQIINQARSITQNLKSDSKKARAIYEWVVNNIKYDMQKYRRQQQKNFDEPYGALYTLNTRLGVCYDYSTLIAALGRASGLQVKVINGNYITPTQQKYHSWNEIYITEKDRWIKLDTSLAYVYDKDFYDTIDFDKDHKKLEEE